MTNVEVDSIGEHVVMSVGVETIELSTRTAFNLVTELLTHIDCARGFGEAMRKEVADPKTLGIRGPYRKGKNV